MARLEHPPAPPRVGDGFAGEDDANPLRRGLEPRRPWIVPYRLLPRAGRLATGLHGTRTARAAARRQCGDAPRRCQLLPCRPSRTSWNASPPGSRPRLPGHQADALLARRPVLAWAGRTLGAVAASGVLKAATRRSASCISAAVGASAGSAGPKRSVARQRGPGS